MKSHFTSFGTQKIDKINAFLSLTLNKNQIVYSFQFYSVHVFKCQCVFFSILLVSQEKVQKGLNNELAYA